VWCNDCESHRTKLYGSPTFGIKEYLRALKFLFPKHFVLKSSTMSDLPSSAAAPETSSGLPTAPAMNNVNVPVEPRIGPSSTAATTEKTPSYLSRVSNTLFSPRKPQLAPSIPRPPLVQRSTSPISLDVTVQLANRVIVEDHPRGYPRLAAFQESNCFWKIYRRFGFLRGRLLLDRQIELAQLEEMLHTIDKEDSERSLTSTMSRTGTEGRTTKNAQRFKDLMSEIAEKLRAYGRCFTPHPDISSKIYRRSCSTSETIHINRLSTPTRSGKYVQRSQ
jgi:hypothetical protein